MTRAVLALLALIWCSAALAQPVTVIGPITPGDCAIFNSTTIIKDSQFACPSSGPALVIGTTTITGGTSNGVLFNNGGLLGNTPSVANAILSTSPTAVPGLNNIITGQNYLAAMTNTGEAFGYSFRNSTVTGQTIYQSIFPSQSFQDGLQSVISIPATATIGQAAALSAYVDNNVPVSGINNNGVALFGAVRCNVDNSACFGINALLQDASSRVAGSGVGRILGNEFDFNVMNPATQVLGVSVGGNSLAQPAVSNAFLVNTLGTGIRWGTGFWCVDNAVSNNCLVAAPPALSGTSIPSTKIIFQHYNGSGVKKSVTLQSQSNLLALTTDDAGLGLSIGTSGLNTGSLTLAGAGGNSVTFQVQPGTALYNFNLPTGAGTAGQPLLSGGGANTAQTYGTLAVPGGGTGITSGTSGGIPYFNSTTTMASSAVLATNGIVTGSGAGAAPSTGGGCSISPASSSLSCVSSTTFSPGFVLQNNTNDNSYVGHGLYKERAGAIVQNNDGIGGYGFFGWDGAAMQVAAQILSEVDAVPGVGSMPGRIVFKTTPSGSVTQTEVFRIDNSQHVQFAAPSIAANGGVATAMTSLGPAGSHTTIQEWLVVKNASGVVRWIPMF